MVRFLCILEESQWLSSAISVFLAVVFVGICSVMAIFALSRGERRHIQVLPDLNNGVSFFDLFTAIPVIVTASTFHFNGKNNNAPERIICSNRNLQHFRYG